MGFFNNYKRLLSSTPLFRGSARGLQGMDHLGTFLSNPVR
jgi:hypothetical protein